MKHDPEIPHSLFPERRNFLFYPNGNNLITALHHCYYTLLKIWCDFYYNDTLSYNINTIENYPDILDGVEINLNSGEHRFLNGTATFTEINPLSRYDNELQKEVVKFINQKKDSLNPWFREEAKKRGVLRI